MKRHYGLDKKPDGPWFCCKEHEELTTALKESEKGKKSKEKPIPIAEVEIYSTRDLASVPVLLRRAAATKSKLAPKYKSKSNSPDTQHKKRKAEVQNIQDELEQAQKKAKKLEEQVSSLEEQHKQDQAELNTSKQTEQEYKQRLFKMMEQEKDWQAHLEELESQHQKEMESIKEENQAWRLKWNCHDIRDADDSVLSARLAQFQENMKRILQEQARRTFLCGACQEKPKQWELSSCGHEICEGCLEMGSETCPKCRIVNETMIAIY